MNSRIYVGQVNHRRLVPYEHKFTYNMFMMYLDLDELPNLFKPFMFWSVNRFNVASFKRSHHMGRPDKSLKQTVIDRVYENTGVRLAGPVRLLTNLSYFGYGFNPVSFYYCFDKEGGEVEMIVAEVNNTPWGEQHCYYLPTDKHNQSNGELKHKLEKEFHVSPFNPMDLSYHWEFVKPGKYLTVYMQNFKDQQKIFDATLALSEQPVNSRSLSKVLVNFPFMTLKIIASIYFEAIKLWFKRTPVYTHPDKLKPPMTDRK